jgi:cytochrome c
MACLLIQKGRLAAALSLAAGLAVALPAAAGDPAHGKGVFAAQCSMCHSSARGGPTILGPTLFGVVGRQSASVVGYNYSPAMKGAGFAWSDDKLRTYLAAPTKMLPGIKMTYGGVKNPAQLDDLMAYLDTLK